MGDREARMRGRLRHRLLGAVMIGPLVGLVVGVTIALVVLDGFGRAGVGIVVGSVVAATLLAMLWAGYSSLESPEPGLEPSDTERPLSDTRLVAEESRDPIDDPSGTAPSRGHGR